MQDWHMCKHCGATEYDGAYLSNCLPDSEDLDEVFPLRYVGSYACETNVHSVQASQT